MTTVRLVRGDSIEVLAELPEDSVDSVVCDPPYGLEFMGKDWDSFKQGGGVGWRAGQLTDIQGLPDGNVFKEKGFDKLPAFRGMTAQQRNTFQQWCETWAREAYRVLKPGGHIVAFGGTRTHHRLVCGIEDAGFEIRDELDWMFGSGFPKSLDVSKAIDKAAGVAPSRIEENERGSLGGFGDAGWNGTPRRLIYDAPTTEAAKQWQGWGTALKPAHEPICLARKPLIGTVAQNVLAHGTGALNIDGTRIGTDVVGWGGGAAGPDWRETTGHLQAGQPRPVTGRWPANVMLDEAAAALLDATVGDVGGGFGANTGRPANVYGTYAGLDGGTIGYGDRGGPSRFFYVAKASRKEREAGLDDLPPGNLHRTNAGGYEADPKWAPVERKNVHPTVKPVALMRWLVRLVTPPGGTVLDPFLGSGTTGIAAGLEGCDFVGVELDPQYAEIAARRIAHWVPGAVVDLDLRPAR